MAQTTLTALFATYDQAHQAVRSLEESGIPSDEITLLANNIDEAISATGAGAGIGAIGGGTLGLLTGLGLMVIPGVGPVVAAGWLAVTAAGAAAGGALGAAAGGLASVLSNAGIKEEEAHLFSEGVRRGGALVVVKTDEADLASARAILDHHHQLDTEALRSDYGNEGWKSFDPNAEPWTPVRIRAERERSFL